MSFDKKNVDRDTADCEQHRHGITDYLQDIDQELDPDFDLETGLDMLESESEDDALTHQFSEEYETQFNANLIKHFGEENAKLVQRSRQETKIKQTAGLIPDPLAEIPPEFLKDDDKPLKLPKEKTSFFNWRGWSSLQRGLIAACIVLVVSFAATMSVDALKVPVINFFSLNESKYNIMISESEMNIPNDKNDNQIVYHDAIEQVYVPALVLKGYEEDDRTELHRIVEIIYKNETDEQYLFYQYVDNSYNALNNEDVNYISVDLKCGEAFYYEEDNHVSLIWDFDGYMFKITGSIAKKEMVELANSLALEK